MAQEPVDIELVLAVDMSISVDGTELDLQRQGFAAAFRDPAVIEAIRANAQGVAVSLVLWAGADQQRTVVDWQHLTDAVQPSLCRHDRPGAAGRPEYFGKTAIGSAMYFALQALDANAYERPPAQDRRVGRRPCQRGLQARAGPRLRGAVRRHDQGLAIINDEPYSGGILPQPCHRRTERLRPRRRRLPGLRRGHPPQAAARADAGETANIGGYAWRCANGAGSVFRAAVRRCIAND